MTAQKLLAYILLYIGLTVVSPLSAARRWVGSGTPAGYDAHYAATNTGIQSAVNDAQYGDKIILGLGTISGINVNLPPKVGNGWIDVESVNLKHIPEGYRAGPAHSAHMPKLRATSGGPAITADVTEYSVTVQVSPTNTLTRSNHGLVEGTPILVDAQRIGAYLCAALSSPDTDCTASRVDHFVHRLGTVNWPTGTPFWVYGHPDYVPPGFSWNRWYYTSSSVTGRFKVSETSGGAEIDIVTPTTDSATTAVAMPYPLAPDVALYVRNPTTNTFQVSLSAAGEIIPLTSSGVSVTYRRLDQKVRGWRFRGLEIEQAPGALVSNMLVYLGSNDTPRHFAEQPSDFVFDRNYIHGQPWENGPVRGLYLNARNVSITNNTIIEAKTYLSGQSQAIFALNSSGDFHVENNELSAQGESVMMGGAELKMVGYQPTNLVFRRNYFHRPLQWYIGVYLSRQSGTLLRAQTWSNVDTCAAASALVPGQRCFLFRPGNETRCVIDDDSQVTPNGAISGSWGFGVKDDCTFTFIHTGNPGDWTCTGDIVCEAQGGSLDWSQIVTRSRSGTITAGTIGTSITSYRLDMRHNFESKSAQRVLVEGNVFNGSWFSSGLTAGADCHVALNVRPSGGTGGPVSFWAQSSEHVFRNNIFKNGVCAFTTAGNSDNSVNFELGTWRQGGRNVFRNNILYEIGNYNWGVSTSHNTSNKPIYLPNADNTLIDHNTIMDVGFYSIVTDGNVQFRNQRYSNNIIVPRNGSTTFPHITNNSGGGNGWQAIMATNAKCVTNTCFWLRNIILNTHPSTGQTTQYPNNATTQTFLASANQNVSAIGFADYANRNYRITSGAYAAGGVNSATDGRALGADQDEIEALTGTLGADVIAGRPEFARRANVILTRGTTTATLKFTPETRAACTVNVWSNPAYSGPETFSTTTESGLTRRIVSITGLTADTQYYGKLLCNTGGADGITILRFATR